MHSDRGLTCLGVLEENQARLSIQVQLLLASPEE